MKKPIIAQKGGDIEIPLELITNGSFTRAYVSQRMGDKAINKHAPSSSRHYDMESSIEEVKIRIE